MKKNLLLLFSVAIILLLLSEFFIRVIFPQSLQRYWVVQEPSRGLIVNKKNHIYKNHRFKNYKATYKFGKFGNRITLHDLKLSGKPRVLVLGDSFTFGWLIKDEDTYVHKLQMDNLNYEFINPSVGSWGTSAYTTFTELYCDEIKPKKILIFLNTDDPYRGFMNSYYKLINGELTISKVELTPINKELSKFDKNIPFYRILKKNSHLFILIRNVVYDLLNPPVLNEWSIKHYYPHPSFIKNYKHSKELFEYNKKIFLRLNDLSKKCGSKLYIFYTGWANIEKMNANNPNKFFFQNIENFFKKNNIYYFNNTKKMTQLYKNPTIYIIKEDYHPNKKGADLIYNLVSDEIKNILLN